MPVSSELGSDSAPVRSETGKKVDREIALAVHGTFDALGLMRDQWRSTGAEAAASAAFGFAVRAAEARFPTLRPLVTVGLGVTAGVFAKDMVGNFQELGQAVKQTWNSDDPDVLARSRSAFAHSAGLFAGDLLLAGAAGAAGSSIAERTLFGKNSNYVRIATFESPGTSNFPRERLYKKSDPLAQVYQKGDPSTVYLHIDEHSQFRERYRKSDPFALLSRGGNATAFIISQDGLMVTNNHVVSGRRSLCFYYEGQHIHARTLAVDPVNDLAVLKAQPESQNLNFRSLTLAQSGVKPGDEIIAISHHHDHRTAALAPGTVRDLQETPHYFDQKERRVHDKNIDFDAVTRTFTVKETSDPGVSLRTSPTAFGHYYSRPGSSGSPIFNLRGEVVGVASGGFGEDRMRLASNYFIQVEPLHALIAKAKSLSVTGNL